MKPSYDILVVGGGPAGCSSALAAVQGGATVLLLEKDAEIGLPVRCAEGVSERSLTELFEADAPWVSNRISKLSFFDPYGTEVRLNSPRVGCILDRAAFDQDLARRAAGAGAEVRTSACVTGMKRLSGKDSWEVSVQGKEKSWTVATRLVIGADGVESRAGRWAGIDTRTSLHDIETCAQYTLAGLDIDPECCQLHFGREIAPGGYLWVFPKGAGTANVGLGLAGEYARERKPLEYLERFVELAFSGASVLRRTGGSVPCSLPLKEPVADGCLLAGDAAHQADPLTGGGIMNAVRAGRLAGEIAAEAISAGDCSKKRLMAYKARCDDMLGQKLRRSYRLKEAIFKLTDEELTATARAVNAIPTEKRSLNRVFVTALVKNPKLLTDILALFGA